MPTCFRQGSKLRLKRVDQVRHGSPGWLDTQVGVNLDLRPVLAEGQRAQTLQSLKFAKTHSSTVFIFPASHFCQQDHFIFPDQNFLLILIRIVMMGVHGLTCRRWRWSSLCDSFFSLEFISCSLITSSCNSVIISLSFCSDFLSSS